MLAAVVAVTTGLLAPIAAASAAAAPLDPPATPSASLTLDLVLLADDGGLATADRFVLAAIADDGSAVLSGADLEPAAGSALSTAVEPGTFALELLADDAARAGHAVEEWRCSGASQVGAAVTIAAGDAAVCTLIADDLPATLSLLADVHSDDGGALTDGAVTLTATSLLGTISGTEGSTAVTDAAVGAGAVVVGALPVDGYDVTGIACWSDASRVAPLAVDRGQVELVNGSHAVCEVSLDDRPAAPRTAILSLETRVINDDGGVAVPPDWALLAAGATRVEGAGATLGTPVEAGAYALSAAGPSGYRDLGWSCTAGSLEGSTVVLEPGDLARCTLVLDDVGATLTLVSLVDPSDGGEASASDWVLEAHGPAPLRGATGEPAVTAVPVPAGAYGLVARGARAGYAAPAWSCVGGALDGATVTIGLGEDVVCTALHDALPVDLAVSIDDGGAIVANGGAVDFTIAIADVGARRVDRDEPIIVTAALPRGASVVAAPPGCSVDGGLAICWIDPSALDAGTATLVLTGRFADEARAGDHSTIATVSTEDDPAPADPRCDTASNGVDCATTEVRYPTITLVQALTTDDGGDATVADFALTATGPVSVSSGARSGAVTAAVPAGSYRLSAAGPEGYATGRWTCVGGALDGSTLTLVGVVDVTCTIGHDDLAVDVRLDARGAVEAPAGGEARVSLVVTNAGGRGVDADEPVTLTHVLAAGLTYLDGPPECSAADRTVTCRISPAALPAGGAVALELLLAVAPDASAGSVESRSTVSTEDDPAPGGGCERPSDNATCTQLRVVVGTVVAEKSVWEHVDGAWVPSDGAVGFGDLVQFRIVVRAGGDAPSTGVGVVDRLPDGLLPDGIATCSTPCTVVLDAATGTHRVEIGTMQQGEAVTVTIAARVPGIPSQAEGTTVRVAFDGAASLSSDTVESAPTNIVTVRASHALPARGRSGGDIPIGGISVALALLVAGGLLLVRSREPAPLT